MSSLFRPSRQLAALATPPLPGITAPLLIAQLDAAQARAMTAAASAPQSHVDAFNEVTAYKNETNEALAALGSADVPRELQMAAIRIVEAYEHLNATGQLPSGWGSRPGGGGGGFPWLVMGIGAVAIGGLWWWNQQQKNDTVIKAAMDAGLMEDCGCDG